MTTSWIIEVIHYREACCVPKKWIVRIFAICFKSDSTSQKGWRVKIGKGSVVTFYKISEEIDSCQRRPGLLHPRRIPLESTYDRQCHFQTNIFPTLPWMHKQKGCSVGRTVGRAFSCLGKLRLEPRDL